MPAPVRKMTSVSEQVERERDSPRRDSGVGPRLRRLAAPATCQLVVRRFRVAADAADELLGQRRALACQRRPHRRAPGHLLDLLLELGARDHAVGKLVDEAAVDRLGEEPLRRLVLERGGERLLELGPCHDLGRDPLRELVLGGRTDGSLGERPREDLVERLFRARLEPPPGAGLGLAALLLEAAARAPQDGADQRGARDHAHREDDDAACCRSRARARDQQSEGHVARLVHISHAPSLPAGPAKHNTSGRGRVSRSACASSR